MPPSEDTFQHVRELTEKALDGSISAEELIRLNDCIVHNAEQRQYYCEYLHMTIGLMRLRDYAPLTGVEECDKLYFESLWRALFAEEKEAPAVVTKESIEAGADHLQEEKQRMGTSKANRFYLGVAAACVSVLLAVLASVHVYQMLIPREVATISRSLDATFADSQTVVSRTRLTDREDRLLLKTGLIKIVFDGGAKVLLEAPTTFRLKSTDQMVLHAGQLFASVPDYARGFTVETPNSRITDMGTEFGVLVEQDGTSDLHLFKGRATLVPESGSQAGRPLTPGEAKRVDVSGRVKNIPIKEEAFVRHFHSGTGFVWRGQQLCLVDLAARGNGLGTGKTNIYVDPIKGYGESPYCTGKGNEYHALPANQFVDGVFIPNGTKRQIVSSQAHEFADCPPTNGECYTTIGANPEQSVWATDMRNGIIQFNGQEYGDKTHPCLVMHANLGITFDLNAIRATCPDIGMNRFSSKIGIADFKESTGCNADFWVLVDGRVRECLRNVTQKNVLSDVSIELGPSDRFLTLVTTDGGDIDRLGAYQRSYTCDWCVFVEPALILETEESTVNMQTR